MLKALNEAEACRNKIIARRKRLMEESIVANKGSQRGVSCSSSSKQGRLLRLWGGGPYGAMGLMTNSDAVFKLRLSSHKATLLVSTIERSTRMETQVCHMQELPGRAERTGTTEMGNLGSSISAAGGA